MQKYFYPIFKLPDYYIRDYQKQELPLWVKWWLLGKAGRKLSEILTGSEFTLLNTVSRKFKIFELSGRTEQEQLEGKNLIAPSYLINGTFITGDVIRNNSGYVETDNTKYRTIRIPNLKAGTYTLSINWNYTARLLRIYKDGVVETIPADANTYTFTTTTDGIFGITFRKTDSTNFNDSDFLVQVELGSIATSYEPYCGGIPSPNPDYPQQIKNVTGNSNVKIQNKNLAIKNIGLGSYGGSVTSTTIHEYTGREYSLLPIKPNTQYTISREKTTSTNFRYFFFDKQPVLTETISIDGGYINDTSASVTFTTPVNAKWLFVQWSGDTTNYSAGTVQIEQGSTATSYVPHQEQNYPFTFAEGQRAMQGTTLEDDGINQKRKQRVLNGTETGWMQNSYATKENTVGFYILLNNIALKNTGELGYLCDKFMALPASNWSADIQGVVQMNDKTLLFKINKSSLITENVAGFKTWLSSNNITVEYTLETEEIIPYNETQEAQYNAMKNVKTYKDETYITSESDELAPELKIQYWKERGSEE